MKKSLPAIICILTPFLVSAAGSFPLTVLPATPGAIYAQPIDGSAGDHDCQPDLFDPAVTPYHKEHTDGSPTDLYVVGNDTYPTMHIDGRLKEGANKAVLQKPMDMTLYNFGCASTSSFVIEIKKDGKRFALYTHVDSDWILSPDQRLMAMHSAIRQPDGSWKKMLRIVTLATKATVRLPVEDCTTHIARWSQGKLITTSNVEAPKGVDRWNYSGQLSASVCVWSPQGKLLARARVEGVDSAGNSDYPIQRIGIIPREKLALYTLLGTEQSYPSTSCRFAAIDIQKPSRTVLKNVPVHLDSYFCAQGLDDIELDLSQFTFARPSLRYRLLKGDEQTPGVRTPQEWQSSQ